MLEECLGDMPPAPVLGGGGSTGATRPGLDGADDRFVGRVEELARLRTAIDAALAGIGGFFLVSGEAGIGKTRLALEVSSDARARGFEVVWGRCWEAGGAPPYWPWIEILRRLLGDPETVSRAELGRHTAQLARLVPETLPGIESAAAPADPESGRFLLFDAVATALRLASTRRPLLVVVDDLHAADHASALLLAFLGRAVEGFPVVMIGTFRDAEAHATPELVDALGELARGATRLPLLGLGCGDVRSVLEGLQGSRPVDGLVDRIHRVTEGNPFFIREIARLLSHDPAGDRGGAGFVIPHGIRETVRQRLEPLPAPVRAVLAVAAVGGREFDGLVVSRAAGLAMIEFLELLEPAIAHAILDVVPGDAVRFSFRHALIQETIYDDLTHADRIRQHGDVRDALEQLSATAPDRYVAELAHHALAAAPAGDERFVEHGVRAARVAMQRVAFEEAVRIFERTIDALIHARPDERRRCELLLALGEAKEWANDRRGSRTVIEQAAGIARRLDAPDLLARAALAVGAIEALKATATSRCETAANLLHEAWLLRDQLDEATQARLRSRLALHFFTLGKRNNALSESAFALRDARASGDTHALAHALIARHAVLLGPDGLGERSAIATELLEIATQLGDHEYMMRALALRVVNALEVGDIATVDEATARHRRLADITRDPFERWANLMWRCARALLVGNFDEATARANEGLELTRNVPGPHAFEVNGPLAYLGQLVLIEDTRFSSALDPGLFDTARAEFEEVLAGRVARLQILTRLERTSEVRDEIERLMAQDLQNADRSGTWLVAISTLAEAVALADDRDRAVQLYPKLLPYADQNVTASFVACRGSVSRFLGLLASTAGRRADAVRHFEDAVAMNRRMGALPHVAATLHDFAAMLLRETPTPGELDRAIDCCQQALQIARSLAMDRLIARCNALLLAHATDQLDTAPHPDFQLVAHGSFWSLTHAGREVMVRDRKGMHYIAELLRNPDRDVHSRDLVALLAPVQSVATPRPTRSAAVTQHADAHAGDFSETLIDPKARRAYQRRLAALEDEMDAAARSGDPEAIAVLREEHAVLARELARITGLGGRIRRADDTERMRLAVTRAIRNALAEVIEGAPDVGITLSRRIRTGLFCRYSSSAPSD